jgi:hypothetical protein
MSWLHLQRTVEAVLTEGSSLRLEVVELDDDRRVLLEHSPPAGESGAVPVYLTATEARSLSQQLEQAADRADAAAL